MVRLGKEAIIEEAAGEFERLVSQGPLRLRPYDPMAIRKDYEEGCAVQGMAVGEEREYMRRLLLRCPNRPDYPTVAVFYMMDNEPFVMVLLDLSGLVRAHELTPKKALGQRTDIMKRFMRDHKPDVIVLNASGGQVVKSLKLTMDKRLVEEVRFEIQQAAKRRREEREERGDTMQYDDDEDETLDYRPHVTILADDLAKIFMRSPRAKKIFPDYHHTLAAAVCLGRFAQEPLAEYCNLWTVSSAKGEFGTEALFLKLHPLQDVVKATSAPLLRALENTLANAVCDIGVEINDATTYSHQASLLAFVAGLGLRKADQLVRSIREKVSSCASRHDLLVKKVLPEKVWQNCVGFLRVAESELQTRTTNPLDNTRIHPECYITQDWAHKICADALEVEHNPLEYFETVVDLMKQVKEDLSKKIKSMRWVDVWIKQPPLSRPSNGQKYTETIQIHSKQEMRNLDVELQDCLALMELDAYTQELEATGHGRRAKQIAQIKEELRYPWLDLRKPLQPPSVAEMFAILTGESDYSLHVGMKIGFTVERVPEPTADRPVRKALGRTDTGIRASVSQYDAFDDKQTADSTDLAMVLPPGTHHAAVVVAVDKVR